MFFPKTLSPGLVLSALLLLMDLPDLFHKPIEIFDQSVVIHKHLAAGRRQQSGRYDRLFQCQIDLPFFVGKNRKGYLQAGFEIIGSRLVVCNGYP